jgi:acyl-CoA reductase-like NAD-dependent aldehyde dehydrogenase
VADADRSGEGRPRDGGPNIFGGPPSEEMRKAMEERVRAGIERLPKDKQAAALARLEEGKRFFEEMSKLSPEERRAKMEDKMEEMMNNSDMAARMSAEGTKRGAMQTASQRADRYRGYLDRKRAANQ